MIHIHVHAYKNPTSPIQSCEKGVHMYIIVYSQTFDEKTLWDSGLCPLFEGCLISALYIS